MARREDNPYAPPSDDDEAPPSSGGERRAFEPATLGRRFMGALVDTVFNLIVLYGVHSAFSLATRGEIASWAYIFGPGAAALRPLETIVASLAPLVIMGTLIAGRAQTVGKMVLMTRIVDAQGRPADLYRGFVLRTLPFQLVAFLPTIALIAGASVEGVQPLSILTSLFATVDVLMIFGGDRRCLHDRVAGTFVAVAGTERPPRPARKKKKKRRKAAAANEG
jgi:uncharacterized RDD family membrane protein YckC